MFRYTDDDFDLDIEYLIHPGDSGDRFNPPIPAEIFFESMKDHSTKDEVYFEQLSDDPEVIKEMYHKVSKAIWDHESERMEDYYYEN